LKDFGRRLQVPNIETISIATDCYGFGNAISKVPKTARHSIIQQKCVGGIKKSNWPSKYEWVHEMKNSNEL
jgi:hypothetical protein